LRASRRESLSWMVSTFFSGMPSRVLATDPMRMGLILFIPACARVLVQSWRNWP
jgi:hypothetical protein